MNNGIEANDNGDEHNVGQPETQRQELLRWRREFEQERQRLLHECERLMQEIR